MSVRFNIGGASVARMVSENANGFGVMLLKTAEADGTLQDYDDIAALLVGSNVEADFTNYARKTGLTGAVTVDDSNNRVDVSIPDQTWTDAGGTTDNTLVKAIVFWDPSTGSADSALIPLTAHDFAVTTNGSDLTISFDPAGFARSAL